MDSVLSGKDVISAMISGFDKRLLLLYISTPAEYKTKFLFSKISAFFPQPRSNQMVL
jgi:hypothetical protein